MSEPTPEITDPNDRRTLRGASGDTLLRTYASLTHQMDHARRTSRTVKQREEYEPTLRAKRDIVGAEILRRMGQISGGHE